MRGCLGCKHTGVGVRPARPVATGVGKIVIIRAKTRHFARAPAPAGLSCLSGSATRTSQLQCHGAAQGAGVMTPIRLKTRYVLTVVAVGLVLTGVAVAGILLSDHLRQAMPQLHGARLQVVVVAGSPHGAGRVGHRPARRPHRPRHDGAPAVEHRTSIGRGHHSVPVRRAACARSRRSRPRSKRMRQALTGTTISRDYLDAVLNSMSDAVLVTTPTATSAP